MSKTSFHDEIPLLVVLIDVNPFVWGSRENAAPPSEQNSPANCSNSVEVDAPEKVPPECVKSPYIGFAQFVEQVFTFIGSYLLLGLANQLSVIAMGAHKRYFRIHFSLFASVYVVLLLSSLLHSSWFLYPQERMSGSEKLNLHGVKVSMLKQFAKELQTCTVNNEEAEPTLSGALSLALCCLNPH